MDGFRERGVFVKEIQRALMEGIADLAIHSLKDLPTDEEEALCIIATPPREDPRDALISRYNIPIEELPKGATIGTSSPRRRAQILHLRRDIEVVPLRGNLDTRIRRVREGRVDAIVVAMAGLRRLGRDGETCQVLSLEEFFPAVGQGALALEARKEDVHLAEMLRFLDHRPTRLAVEAERALLRGMGGGCQVPVGAFGFCKGERLRLSAMICDLEGKRRLTHQVEGPAVDATLLGESLAGTLMEMGGREIMFEDS